MSSRKRKRRSPGEGSVFEFTTKADVTRYGIKFLVPQPDGTLKQVLRRRGQNGEIWEKYGDAAKALRDALGKVDRNEWVEPSKQPLGEYLDEWAAGLRLADSTVASYRKNIRLHLKPYLGGVPLASLTTAKINELYRTLEGGGRRDHKTGGALSARTVRYIHTILRAALQAAVESDRLTKNPADRADPPTAKQAKAPEMHPWSDDQLRAFLDWSKDNSALHTAWYVLAMTGMRRGELLALRWRDVDLDAGTISVRRSVGLVRNKGKGAEIKEGPTKTSKPRVVDIDDATVTLLRAHRRERGNLALQLGRDDALVFGDHEGRWRHPERFSRTFKAHLNRCRRDLAKRKVEPPEEIRVHDLRHTHATILLRAGVHPKIVSERLGHANVSITLDTYSHVLPTIQREAVAKLAAIMGGNA
ncbi:MAG: tyrosine-type recombinase/integrase [Streptosporangiales bacterium]|nr:tyrosine-type recombinase/integrase [Streptosporangiales bacterium]